MRQWNDGNKIKAAQVQTPNARMVHITTQGYCTIIIIYQYQLQWALTEWKQKGFFLIKENIKSIYKLEILFT